MNTGRRNRHTKTLILLLTALFLPALALSAFAAGSQEDGAEESGSTGGLTGYLASSEPITLTFHAHVQNSSAADGSLPVWQKAAELTNVTLETTAPTTATNSLEVYNLMIASGEIADIVGYPNFVRFTEDAMDGAFLPLNDLIDEQAPHFKKVLEENPDVKAYITAPDGNIYAIPYFYDLNAPEGWGWFIRTDWLDTLGLDIPNNVYEYYRALKAFREQDPNGNGEKDEAPYFSRGRSPFALLILWNAHNDFFVKNGVVGFGPYEPEYRTGLTEITKWYAEGLIHSEIFTGGSNAREVLLSQDKGGATQDWFASTSSYNGRLQDEIDGFAFKPFAPPAGVDGVRRNDFRRPKIIPFLGWGMGHTNKDPNATMRYFDFWFTERGIRLAAFGIEGEDYTMVDGTPVFTDAVTKADVPVITYLNTRRGAQYLGMGTMQDIRYELQAMHPYGREGYDMYSKSSWGTEQMPLMSYEEDEFERLNEIMASVRTLVSETAQKWVLGAEDIDSNYDSFIRRMRDMGIEEAIEITQTAYERIYD